MSVTPCETTTERDFFVHPEALVESTEIGRSTRVWAFAHVMRGARVGSDCNIGDHAFIETGAIVGNNVTVKHGVAIWDRVTIEDNVFWGPNCVLTNDLNPRAYIKKSGSTLVPTLIRENATIGANVTIVCGVTIGQYAFIGAGAVIIRSVPNFALIVGNPG
jgi:UDP-2-acetamido-3-amino-2,3-dideoxy-glucuronate N-acetyltransferase